MARIEIKGDRWIELSEVEDVTSGTRKKMLKAAKAMAKSVQQVDGAPDIAGADPELLIGTSDLLAAYLFVGWGGFGDGPAPSPVDPSPFDEVPARDMDRVYAHCNEVMSSLMDTGSDEPSPDPASPTSPSDASPAS